MVLHHSGDKFIRIGYRSPGLSAECTPAQKMELALELGMEVIEPQLADKEFPDFKMAEEYRRQAERSGIRVETAGTSIKLANTSDRKTLDQQIDRMLHFADIIGFSYVFNCVEFPPDGSSQAEVWNLVVDNVKHCIDRFGQAGLRFALEPEWFIASAERMRRLCRMVDSEALYVNYDPTNFYVAGSDALDALDTFGDRIVNGHIKDALYCVSGRRERPVGEGELDYAAIFTDIIRRGLSINMHIEHCSSAAAVRAAAAHIRLVLDKVRAA